MKRIFLGDWMVDAADLLYSPRSMATMGFVDAVVAEAPT
jgi:hypothetical protein